MKKNKLPNLVSIMILTLLTSILWVSLTVYLAFTSKPTESVPEAISNPITPELDNETIKKIESGIFFDASQIPEGAIVESSTPLAQPTPIPETTPIASSSAETIQP